MITIVSPTSAHSRVSPHGPNFNVAASIQMQTIYIPGKQLCGPKWRIMFNRLWALTLDTMVYNNFMIDSAKSKLIYYRVLHNSVGSVTSKHGSQCSKRLPTATFFSIAPLHRNGRQRCIHSLYSNIYWVSSLLQWFCKSCTMYLPSWKSFAISCMGHWPPRGCGYHNLIDHSNNKPWHLKAQCRDTRAIFSKSVSHVI